MYVDAYTCTNTAFLLFVSDNNRPFFWYDVIAGVTSVLSKCTAFWLLFKRDKSFGFKVWNVCIFLAIRNWWSYETTRLIPYNICSNSKTKKNPDAPNGRLKLKKLACMSEWKGRSSRRLTPPPGIFCTPLVSHQRRGALPGERSARCTSMECDPPQVGQLGCSDPRRHRQARSSCARKPPDWSLALRLVSPSINVETHPSRQHNEL